MANILFIGMLSMIMVTSTLCSEGTETHREVTHPTMNLGSSSLRGMTRVLAQINPTRVSVTCDNYPRLCREDGSRGPDCCRKQCVNVDTDVFNCGQCGRACRYGEACCGGRCVKVSSDRNNCGSCYNKCNKGGSCKYGMCSYAN